MIYHSSQLPINRKIWIRFQEDMFLFCAWSIGLGIGENIHRHEMFGFIQTNIENKGEENLQGVIEKSIYWDNQKGSGEYYLNKYGKSRIVNFFGTNPNPIERVPIIKLWRNYHGIKYTIELNSLRKRLLAFIDEESITGVGVIRHLDSIKVKYQVNSSSATSRFWNWIIQDNDYYWER